MAIDAGYGGTITGPDATVAAQVRNWTLRDMAQLHDTTVMGQSSRRRTKGVEDWNVTCDFFGASDSALASAGPGTAISVALTTTGAASNNTYTGSAIIESIDFTRDVDAASRGVLTAAGNGTLTRPTSAA